MYNEKGEEILDPKPVAIPMSWRRPLDLNARIRQMVREEASIYAQGNGMESFEEADDFDVEGDRPDPTTPYEEDFDPQVPYVATREKEIHHGVVSPLDEKKIIKGHEEYRRLKELAEKEARKKAFAKRKREQVKEESELESDESDDEKQ